MAEFTRENIDLTKKMVKAQCSGQMVGNMWEDGMKTTSMGLEFTLTRIMRKGKGNGRRERG